MGSRSQAGGAKVLFRDVASMEAGHRVTARAWRPSVIYPSQFPWELETRQTSPSSSSSSLGSQHNISEAWGLGLYIPCIMISAESFEEKKHISVMPNIYPCL